MVNINRILITVWLVVFVFLAGILYARVLISQHSDTIISGLMDTRIGLEEEKIALLERELNVRRQILETAIVINTARSFMSQVKRYEP